MKRQTIQGGQVGIDLGELEREVGLLAAGIVGKGVDPAPEIAEKEPAGSLGPNQSRPGSQT